MLYNKKRKNIIQDELLSNTLVQLENANKKYKQSQVQKKRLNKNGFFHKIWDETLILFKALFFLEQNLDDIKSTVVPYTIGFLTEFCRVGLPITLLVFPFYHIVLFVCKLFNPSWINVFNNFPLCLQPQSFWNLCISFVVGYIGTGVYIILSHIDKNSCQDGYDELRRVIVWAIPVTTIVAGIWGFLLSHSYTTTNAFLNSHYIIGSIISIITAINLYLIPLSFIFCFMDINFLVWKETTRIEDVLNRIEYILKQKVKSHVVSDEYLLSEDIEGSCNISCNVQKLYQLRTRSEKYGFRTSGYAPEEYKAKLDTAINYARDMEQKKRSAEEQSFQNWKKNNPDEYNEILWQRKEYLKEQERYQKEHEAALKQLELEEQRKKAELEREKESKQSSYTERQAREKESKQSLCSERQAREKASIDERQRAADEMLERQKREREADEEIRTTIATAKQIGSCVNVYNAKGNIIFTVPGKLRGWTSQTVTVANKNFLNTYDNKGHQIMTQIE